MVAHMASLSSIEAVSESLPAHIQTALALRAEGLSWRDVAARMGAANHVALYRECRSFDRMMRGDERYRTLGATVLEGAMEAASQLTEALVAREFEPSQLPVITGILTDKVVNMRRLELQGAQGASGAGELVAQVLGALQSGGGKLTLEVEVPRTLDVEASDPSRES
jgi:hypothetical protein